MNSGPLEQKARHILLLYVINQMFSIPNQVQQTVFLEK